MNTAGKPAAGDAPFQVRELGIGGILDDALLLWKRNFLVFAGVTVCLWAPCDFLALWAISAAVDLLRSLVTDPSSWPAWAGINLLDFALQATFSAALLATLFEAMICGYAAQDYMGRERSLGYSIRRTFRLFWRLVPVHIPFYIAYWALTAMCVVPGAIFYATLLLRIPVMVLEDGPVFPSLVRAVQLVWRRWFTALMIICILITMEIPLEFLYAFIPNPLLSNVLQDLTKVLIGGFEVTVVTVLYFALRSERESLDLELMTQAVGPEYETEQDL